MTPEFDWSAESPVIPEQAAIAVYTNPHGNIVVRQAGQYGPDEDTWIVLAPGHAAALADAIRKAAGLDGPLLALAGPKDRSAAERQRRYRERQRDIDNGYLPSRHSVVTRDAVTHSRAD